jgi:hypothetical protein
MRSLKTNSLKSQLGKSSLELIIFGAVVALLCMTAMPDVGYHAAVINCQIKASEKYAESIPDIKDKVTYGKSIDGQIGCTMKVNGIPVNLNS